MDIPSWLYSILNGKIISETVFSSCAIKFICPHVFRPRHSVHREREKERDKEKEREPCMLQQVNRYKY